MEAKELEATTGIEATVLETRCELAITELEGTAELKMRVLAAGGAIGKIPLGLGETILAPGAIPLGLGEITTGLAEICKLETTELEMAVLVAILDEDEDAITELEATVLEVEATVELGNTTGLEAALLEATLELEETTALDTTELEASMELGDCEELTTALELEGTMELALLERILELEGIAELETTVLETT